MNESTISATTVDVRPPVREPGFFRLDPTPQGVTDEEVAWSADMFGELPVVILPLVGEVRHWRGDDGRWYRQAGVIVVTPGYRIRISLYPGAEQRDLRLLEREVEWLQAGALRARRWREKVRPDAAQAGWRPGWWWDSSFQVAGPLDEHTPRDVIWWCKDDACASEYHVADEYEDCRHQADEVDHDGWAIELYRFEQDDWSLYLGAGDGELTADQAASLAMDLQWMAAECRLLNGRRRA